jgi:molybdate transport system substrate-binding protein
MKKITIPFVAFCLAIGMSCTKTESVPSTLSVAAAASLRDLLEQTAPRFEAAHPGTKLRFSFEASSTLSRQIEAGADFQVFLSADRDNVERIRTHVDSASIAPYLANTLVLVGSRDMSSTVKSPADLRSQPGKISLAGPQVPVGKYARIYLGKQHLLQDLEPKIVTADNVRASLAMVEAGSTDFAFVYSTDAKIAKKAVVLWIAKGEDDPGILYVGAVVTAKAPLAAEYFEWVRGPEFQAQARQLGFLPPPKQP